MNENWFTLDRSPWWGEFDSWEKVMQHQRQPKGTLFTGVLVMILTTLLLACSGSDSSDSSGPTVENLEARNNEAGSAFLEADWGKFREFLHPNVQSNCSSEEVAETMSFNKAQIRSEFGVDVDADLEARASNVEVAGNRGGAVMEYYHGGNLLFRDESTTDWEFVKGQWHLAEGFEGFSCRQQSYRPKTTVTDVTRRSQADALPNYGLTRTVAIL